MTPEDRIKVEAQTRNYTLLDYLYRLRIRTNYKDAAIFTEGPEYERESKSARVSLIRIVSMSLLASELILLTCPDGPPHLKEWAQNWFDANVPNDLYTGIKERIHFW